VDVSYYGDCDIVDWKAAGLPLPTKAKGVIQTVERDSIDYQYGSLTNDDLESVKSSVRMLFAL
jgi:hypothetical protein